MQDRKFACRGDLEYHSTARAASTSRCPVETPIAALNHAGEGVLPMGGVKAEKQCKFARGCDREDDTGIGTRPERRGSIEVAVRAQDQGCVRCIAVGDVELIEGSEGSFSR